MESDRVPLYVRLPRDQAAALDHLVSTTGQRKQQLVSDLLADRLQLGRLEFNNSISRIDVLTLAELAELLRVDEGALANLARRGVLPARQVAGEWRFAREAVMRWLEGEESETKDARAAGG